MGAENAAAGRARYQIIGLLLGPVIAFAMLLAGAPPALEGAAWFTAAIGLLMAIWWATEAVPIAVTSFLPIVFFPLFGIASIDETVEPYSDEVIFLFLGGFVVAIAMQRWNLHRRVALIVLQYSGGSGRSLVGGFMLAGGLISMWVSNTSTAMMLLPMGLSVVAVIHNSVRDLDERQRTHFQYALMLGIAYAATIGGMATLVGTAPNAIFAAFMKDNYGTEIAFANWLLVGVPVSALMLPLAWLTLTRAVFQVDFRTSDEARQELRRLKAEMGVMSAPEKRVAVIFVLLVALWITRPLLNQIPGLAGLEDSMIAMAGAIALFLIPSGSREDPLLLRWDHAERLPWGVLVLFGGGLSLARAVSDTGLAEWIGTNLQGLGALSPFLVVLIMGTVIIFITELISNTAVTTTFLPIVGAIAVESGFDPLLVAVPVTLGASCAFMLPVATPPNAIVFGSGLLTIPKMVRAGIALNIISIVIVTAAAYLLAPRVL